MARIKTILGKQNVIAVTKKNPSSLKEGKTLNRRRIAHHVK